MNTYHVVYFEKPNVNITLGVNLNAHTMQEALKKFKEKYKVEPFYIMKR